MKSGQMKRYRICFHLMMKRMLKKPAFVFFLLGLPLLAAGIGKLEQGGNGSATAGVAIDSEMAASIANEADRDWNRAFLSLLAGQDGILQFRVYEEKEQLVRDVKAGELDCGVVLPADMRERVDTGKWRGAVILYQTSSAAMTEIVKERVAGAVFTLFSEACYAGYIESTPLFDNAEADGNTREEIVSFAKTAYESHLLDDSTFAFQYQGEGYTGNYAVVDSAETEQAAQEADGQAGPGFRLRGVLAVCIFLSGLCGLLTDFRDRQEQRFVRIAPAWLTTMVNIWIPTIYTSLITLVSLGVTGQIAGTGAEWGLQVGVELCRLLFYQLIIVAYCSMLRLVIRKQETIAAAVPLFTLASMICCPVWIRLAVYLPVFRVLEKMFPATYYLLM